MTGENLQTTGALEASDAAAQAVAKSAERVTLDHLKSLVVNEEILQAGPQGLMTIAVLTVKNGFTVTGESACADPENYDPDLGVKLAREAAISKLWPLEGYLLRQKLHDQSLMMAASGAQEHEPELVEAVEAAQPEPVNEAVASANVSNISHRPLPGSADPEPAEAVDTPAEAVAEDQAEAAEADDAGPGMPQLPSVGRMVHFYSQMPQDTGSGPGQPVPAIISRVLDRYTVNLTVIRDGGAGPLFVPAVPYGGGHPGTDTVNGWTWPPRV